MSEEDENDLVVLFEGLTEAQALTLRAMFEKWKSHIKAGSSRSVSFYVDGDGSFHPEIKIASNEKADLTDEVRKKAEPNRNRFDFDGVAWHLRED